MHGTHTAQVPEGPPRGTSAGSACEYFSTPLGIIFNQSKSVASVDRLDVLVVPGTILSVLVTTGAVHPRWCLVPLRLVVTLGASWVHATSVA